MKYAWICQNDTVWASRYNLFYPFTLFQLLLEIASNETTPTFWTALDTYYQDAGRRTDRSARPVFQCAPYSIIDGKKWPRAINDFSSTFLCGKKGNEIFCRIVSEFQTACYILYYTPGLILYASMGAGKVVVMVVEGMCRREGHYPSLNFKILLTNTSFINIFFVDFEKKQ